jgi:hypothetical protein
MSLKQLASLSVILAGTLGSFYYVDKKYSEVNFKGLLDINQDVDWEICVILFVCSFIC